MKTICGSVFLLAAIVMAGCDGKERELEMKNAQLMSEKDSIHAAMQNREKYFDEVVTAINNVYLKLEDVRSAEENISMRTRSDEGTTMLSNDQSRQNLLDQIEEIDNTLLESRKEITRLEAKIGSLNRDFAGLNDMISNLKAQLDERAQRIAMLEEKVTGLESDIVEKVGLISQRDSVIQTKETELNTVYYIVGTRSELEEKGIITDEGGFLWGLLGSASMLSSGVDKSLFKPLDKTKDWEIAINGEIDEIIPKRNGEYFAADKVDEEKSNLRILDPKHFWQERYLVVVSG